MYQVLNCLVTEHDWRLVVLGGAICWLASAVAISLLHRARASQGRTRAIWVGLDAAVGGCGIWATHFVAMLAYDPGAGAGYNIPVTLISLVFAVAISAVGLGIASLNERRWTVAMGGAVVGLGVAAMHYTGMMALELPARIVWSPGIVLASVVFGSVFAAMALVVAVRRDDRSHTLAATGLLTVAIVSHHFTAMGAVTLVPDPTLVIDELTIAPAALSFLIAVAAFAILGISLVAAMLDRRSSSELHQQKVLLDSAIGNMSQGLCMFDAEGRILLFNERYSEMMDRTGMPLQGRMLIDVLQDQKSNGKWDGDPDEFFNMVVAAAKAGETLTRVVTRNGRSIRVVDQPKKGGGWVATFEDITEWQQAQERISHMARHDALTNLPNRTLFREQLEKALRLAKRSDQLAVFCLDLDHFKEINDTLGHPVGDALLKEVARRLGECVTEHDTVARLGGDEFAVVQFCSDCDPSAVSLLASHIVEQIGEPYDIGGHQLVVGVSIGISLAPEDGKNPDELLKNADLALYRAKADGRGTYRYFETGMDARAQARRILELDLRAALQRHEFEVYYQPIRDVASDEVVAFEALVRWNHSLRGLISPVNFIPLAEETGLIVQLGDWVLRQACMDATGWPDNVDVAVNLSPVQFKNPNLVSSVKAALRASGLPAHRLELEITESVLLQNSAATLAVLHELRGFGVRISLDDFGTGYSSLSYLRSFPFDKIKIDRSFVNELTTRDDSMAIVRAVTSLGKSLGIVTTAEGVETEAQFELLRREGCTQAQGYLFSQPRPAAEVNTMLSRPRARIVA
ncbi:MULTISPECIES: bifunctional diguanylate cyclase/phosphodiesterase [Bradyrhizobium]|uniref:Diguanylate cyclase (GGDEF) domain-containing protein n=2 Tax=Bradyrhizobium TaxID=374 RepID=A0ABY0Q9X4_9BRAD|nr:MULTISPECIES: EAL domain-containing protein [Bradyrhizobium]SDJ75196.1 diguanylate cyclase (GGDEF) domain-containing protein [Bradyrhizobium ottawaense]SEC17376.1 diguanylate cyclase (GGDEF) domain-containing protein [Bradyrhizobium lablabi]SHM78659.1 diguanylate cyclase (GGDEF) domain-containing protein [Bradyrhizobium lablabi]